MESMMGWQRPRVRARPAVGRVVLGPAADGARRRYLCSFIAAGRVKQADQRPADWLIPAEVLAAAAELFAGRPCYLDHPDLLGMCARPGAYAGADAREHQAPKVRNLAGVTFDARWDADAGAVMGGLRLYDRAAGSPGHLVGVLFDQMLEDRARGLAVPPIGLSAVFFHTAHFDEARGLTVTDVIHYVESVDVVYDPGAAGYVRQALAAVQQHPYAGVTLTQGDGTMHEERDVVVAADLAAGEARDAGGNEETQGDLPGGAVERRPQPEAGPGVASDAGRLDRLQAQVERLVQAMANVAEAGVVRGVEAPGVRHVRAGLDRVTAALEAMLDGVRPPADVPPLSGVRELYTLLSGDFEMTGRFNPERVYLANVTSSTLAGLVADALNKRVVNVFQSYPAWWAPAVTIEEFTSLQQVKWITLGGIGELPTVPEGAAYSELAWDDQTETADFVKKGGYLGITIEAIDKDDTRKLRTAPRALAQAAWLTLGKAISNVFTANNGYGVQLSSDNGYLFHTDRSNLGTTAFSHVAWKATKLAMMKAAELNSGERLAALVKPHLLWVPIDLEDDAVAELASGEGLIGSPNYDVNVEAAADSLTARIARARERVVVCPFWTDTADWMAQADPRLYPGLGLGFRYGRTPEIFSVASPTAGLMFSNDTMPIKARFFFAVGPTDWRAFYKHVVG